MLSFCFKFPLEHAVGDIEGMRKPQNEMGKLIEWQHKCIKKKILNYFTSLIITGSNSVEFSTERSTVFADINEWFRSNLMSLNFDKTHVWQF